MLALTKQDIMNSFTMKHAIEAVKLAFSMYSSGKSLVPLRTNIRISQCKVKVYLCLLIARI